MKDSSTNSDAARQEQTSPIPSQMPGTPAPGPPIPPTGSVPPAPPEQSAPRDPEDQPRDWWPVLVGIITLAIAAALALVLAKLIRPISDPNRMYVALSAGAGTLVLGGLIFLISVIPAAASKSNIRTELYSVRAAYLCVIAGLILIGIVAIGLVFAQVMQTVGRH